jgi:fumarate hydratase class II
MGDVEVPDDAWYGASTQRAVDNFPLGGTDRSGTRFLRALGLVKAEAARVNGRIGVLPREVAAAVAAAADEVAAGEHDDQFVVGGGVFSTDVFQSGSGTSMNMNANEVIANRATVLLGGKRGDRLVHPNDHVNAGQSSNDVVPTALHMAAVAALREDLVPALDALALSLDEKAAEFDDVLKSGRTHLMDATPIRLGQEFGGYAAAVRKGIGRVESAVPDLLELALGGTAVGTGINAPDGFAAAVIAALAERTGYPYREAPNHFEAQGARDASVHASGALKTVAVSLFKIANDIRWLASGPSSGIGELRLPALQPGSSIMAIGNDAAVTWGGAGGNFELNVMMPLIARNLLESIGLLAASATMLRERCVGGITADAERAADLLARNVSIVTALAPRIGYDGAAAIAKRAAAERRTVREVALEMGLLSPGELDEALDVRPMTGGGMASPRPYPSTDGPDPRRRPMNDEQLAKVRDAAGFVAALDQSGGSTPKALRLYGISEDAYSNEDEMFHLIHEMRTRIITSPSFDGDRILGAILFEMTMDREIEGMGSAEYLWTVKNVVPFLKVDKGLAAEADGVQLMKPIPDLESLLSRAVAKGVFGTKMRSVVTLADPEGVDAIADQQFEIGRRILGFGLVPIIEPEIDIHSPQKAEAEGLLKAAILRNLESIPEGRQIMLKLTLPDEDGFYAELVEHPKVLRVVALSGGYTREEANSKLARNPGVIASFSRALTEGLSARQSDEDFDTVLDESIGSILAASMA